MVAQGLESIEASTREKYKTLLNQISGFHIYCNESIVLTVGMTYLRKDVLALRVNHSQLSRELDIQVI